MVGLVIALSMCRHQSIPEVAAHLDLVLPEEFNPDIAKSALTQARQRMGVSHWLNYLASVQLDV